MPGIHVTDKIKTDMTYLGNQFFSEGRHQGITCIDILEALLVWGGSKNTDIGSALHLVFLLLHLTKDTMVELINEQKASQGAFIKLGQNHYETEHKTEPGAIIKLGRRVA
jgi:hypothetical protein